MTTTATEQKSTILVVDDTPDNLERISGLLDGKYKVKIANSGQKALSLLAGSLLPDLILLDVMMPGIDGYEVCRRLKSDDRTRDIPVIFLTAMSSIEAEERGFDLGAVDYISKPISPPILMARIKTHLALKASADSMRESFEKVQEAHQQLRETFHQLVRAEKMAALSQLVVGVAHEINTPLGVAVTAASLLDEQARKLAVDASNGMVRKSDFIDYLAIVTEISPLLADNLRKVSNLVESFKLVAADHSDNDRQSFTINTALTDILSSLSPIIKEHKHTVCLNCQDDLQMNSFRGALMLVMTNMIKNSIVHAFDHGQAGVLSITVSSPDKATVELVYTDNGKGIPESDRNRVFDPFFTTKRYQGNPGLGLHIVFNLVTTQLGGTIVLDDDITTGSRFTIRIPKTAPIA